MKTVAMIVSEEAYGSDTEMNDLVSLALKDHRVRVILVPEGELQELADAIRSENDSQ